MEVYLMALYVSLEQEEAIQQLFKEKKWLLDKIALTDIPVEFVKALPRAKDNEKKEESNSALTDIPVEIVKALPRAKENEKNEESNSARAERRRKVANSYKTTRKKPELKPDTDLKQTRVVGNKRKCSKSPVKFRENAKGDSEVPDNSLHEQPTSDIKKTKIVSVKNIENSEPSMDLDAGVKYDSEQKTKDAVVVKENHVKDLTDIPAEFVKALPRAKDNEKKEKSNSARAERRRKVANNYKATRKKPELKPDTDLKQTKVVRNKRKCSKVAVKIKENSKGDSEVLDNSLHEQPTSDIKKTKLVSVKYIENLEPSIDLDAGVKYDSEQKTKDVKENNVEGIESFEQISNKEFNITKNLGTISANDKDTGVTDIDTPKLHDVIDVSMNIEDFIQNDVKKGDIENSDDGDKRNIQTDMGSTVKGDVKTEVKHRTAEVNRLSLEIIREVVKNKVKQTAKKLEKNNSLKKTNPLKNIKSEVQDKNRVKDRVVEENLKKVMLRPKKNGSLKRIDPLKETFTKILKEETKEKPDIEFLSATFKKNGNFFICPYCQRKFEWLGPFTKHVVRHRRNEFDCNACGKKFTNYRSLMAHKYSRKKERIFHCDLCGHSATTACMLRQHNKEKHPPKIYYQCHMCPKILKTKSYLNVHLKFSHNVNDGKYECNICGKILKRKKLLENHMKVHSEEPPIDNLTCEYCGKAFQTKLHLRSHSRIHKDKKYLCDYCGKGFCTKTKLHAHHLTHTGEKPYACTKCSYRSTQRGNLRLHMKVHDKPTPEKKVKQPYNCPHCNYTTKRLALIQQHLKTHTKASNKRRAQNKKETVVNDIIQHQHEKALEEIAHDNSAYEYFAEKALLRQSYTHKAVTDSSAMGIPKMSLDKDSSTELGKDVETTQDTSALPTDNKPDISTDPATATYYPGYLESYTAYQYNQARSAYQDTAPHLMYLNQQRYYDAHTGIYDSSKYTDSSNTLYSEPKYSAEITHVKTPGASDRLEGSTTKLDSSTQSLLLSSSGQILRQMLAASQDLYHDSTVSNSYTTRQSYQDSESAYDASYSGVYNLQPEDCDTKATSVDRSSIPNKQQDFNLNLKSDLNEPAGNYSADNLDPYAAANEHDFTTNLRAVNSSQLLSYIESKQQTHLYPTPTLLNPKLPENESPIFPSTEQDFSYEDLERPPSAFRRVSN